MELKPRGLRPRLERMLGDHPVVVLEGARAVGKTTLANQLLAEGVLPGEYISLDREREVAAVDPLRWLRALPFGSVVDEAQLLPDLLLAAKRVVDEDPTPGRLLLTGSSRLRRDSLGGSDALAGRSARVQLHPFTLSEQAGFTRSLVGLLREGDPARWAMLATADDVHETMATGGLPLMSSLSEAGRSERLGSYPDRSLSDSQTAGSRHGITMRLVRHLFESSPAPENTTDIARRLGISRDTVLRHLDLLEESFLVWRQPGFVAGTAGELQRALIVGFDTGVMAASRLGRSESRLGSDLETFVLNEVRSQLSWSEPGAAPVIYHWRFKNRAEVDVVLEFPGGDLVAIEVRAASDPDPAHLKWLTMFRERYASPDRAVRTYVFYLGERCVPYLDHWFVPVGALAGVHEE